MKISVLLAFVCAMFMALSAVPANAQVTRSWVSGVGDDANPCSRTAPCKTWAGAISKTAAGGEIDALDPGGFGALTITKSITLDGGGGQVASILVAGTNGITVAAGSTDVVLIKNLRFQGLLGNGSSPSSAGLIGVSFLTGATLILDHVEIVGFNGAGVGMSNTTAGATLAVMNSAIENCAGGGIVVSPNGVAGRAFVTNTSMIYNKFGLRVNDNGKVAVSDSSSANNTNNGFTAVSASAAAELTIKNSVISSNVNSGIATSGTNALVRIANSTITDNGTSINTSAGGNVTSTTPATNLIAGNGTNNGPTGTATPLQ